jgi:type IV pilus assembly protein PilF
MNGRKSIAVIVAFVLLHAFVGEADAARKNKPPRTRAASEAPSRSSDAEAAVANMNLGAGYLRQGRYDLAIERLQRALKQDPRLADAHSTIAIAYDQLGDAGAAEDHYKRATQLEPSNPGAANAYAVFLCRQNRWSDAEPFFKRAVDNPRYPTPEVALANAGVCALNGGDREKAQDNFRAALAKNPTFADALQNMLELSYQDKNFMQARAFLQRYTDVKPATAPVLFMCFNIERQLDNGEAANRCASQLREQFPNSAEVAQLRELQQTNGR